MSSARAFRSANPVTPIRGVHLDLKGVPPTPSRLLELLRIFAAARYNAVLVEWEDAFPWTVDERFRSPTAYSSAVIRQFCSAAADLGIEVIPLVQCLGHMETPLNISGYENLRELPHDAFVLHPLAPGARELVQSMVDDVLRLMPATRFLHLGGDEAWSLGQNPATADAIARNGKAALYLQHVGPILDTLISRGIRPILWHDMMIEWDSDALKALSAKADLMAWGYRGHPDDTSSHFNTRHLQRLHDHGLTLWGGTAYKGADGHNIDLPDPAARYLNASAWVDVAGRFPFSGIIATGWSRYSTHRLQCEPIDATLDVLVGVGILLHEGELPSGASDIILGVLEEVGEKDHFTACRSAMTALTSARVRGWKAVQNLREQIALSRGDVRRRGSAWEARFLGILHEVVEAAEAAAAEVRRTLAGCVEPVWIEEYLASRISPLRDELTALDLEAQNVDPAAWEAARLGRLGY